MKGAVLLLAAVTAVTFVAREVTADARSQAVIAIPARTSTSVQRPRPGPVPLLKQAFRNNCETASLSMLLAAAGVRVDQRVLQREVAKSGPLDPIIAGEDSWIWGDPDAGFVGRVAGGGRAGGFGVYQTPIRLLARRHGVQLADLSRRNVSAIVDRLRAGRPVMAWIGLSQGPYRRWRTPTGEPVVANFGEHVVVLTGISGTTITANDPLSGGTLTWSVSEFARRWRLLGKRALGL